MVVSYRVVRILEFVPIALAVSTLIIPVVLALTSAHLTIRGVNACFWSAAPPIVFP
jgi:hypothetical protein